MCATTATLLLTSPTGKKGKGGKGSGEEAENKMGLCLSKEEVSLNWSFDWVYHTGSPPVKCRLLLAGALPLCHGDQHAGQV